MTTRQSAESNMLEILGLYLEKNKAVTDVLKMIGKGAAKLAARKSNIDALEKLQSGTTKGVTAVKKTTLEQIKLAGETHRSNLIGFATDANKLDSFADFVMSPTAFKTGGEVKIMARCKDLLTATRTVETDANAAIYKLSKTDNDEFETLLNSYKPKKNTQTTEKNTQKKITLDIKQEFDEVHKILKRLDSDVKNNASTKYPDFVEGYNIARKVIIHRGPPPPPKDPPSPPKGE